MGVLHSSGYVYWVERGKLAVGVTSNNGVTVTPPSTASHSIRLYVKEVAPVDNGSGTEISEFSTGTSINLAEFSKLPAQFHEGLIAKVLEKLYQGTAEGLQAAQYWRTIYEDHRRKAMRYANSRRNDSGVSILQHDM